MFDELIHFLLSIRDTLTDIKESIMAIPEVIRDAIRTEIEEGKKYLELIENLKALMAQKDALIAELQALLSGKESELESVKAQLEAKIEELAQNAIDTAELVEAIAAINPTPVSDAVVEEVVENPEIPTPPIVEDAPPTDTGVVQDPEVVDSALDAIDAAEPAPEVPVEPIVAPPTDTIEI